MNKLCDKLSKKWGITDNFRLASFILPNGKLVGSYGNPPHEEMISSIIGKKKQMCFSEFIEETKCIRCCITNSNIELGLTVNDVLTPEQEHTVSICPNIDRIIVDLVFICEDGERYKYLGVWEKSKINDFFDYLRRIR